ncbi:MAG: ABC transporter permease [Gemmatimonadetes bacterium]|nr:ABC transporter permease [Gemmatimonadota bacterium]
MADAREEWFGRLDRLEVERLARSAGLPTPLSALVAEVVTRAGLAEERRGEVFAELVGHFHDGLAAGRSPDELIARFGDRTVAARLIREEKRLTTPEALGGAGSGEGWFRRLLRDIRYAARRLLARPAFTLTAVASLALGIGANAAIFTLVNDVILRPPPVAEPERLVNIYISSPTYPFNVFSYPELEEVRRETRAVFSGFGGARYAFAPRDGEGGPEMLPAEAVNGDYFAVLGLRPQLGRLIDSSDAPVIGQQPVAVLSDRYWRRAFGASPTVLGQPIRLSGAGYTVIGIAPPDYLGTNRGLAPDLFLPVTMMPQLERTSPEELNSYLNHSVFVRARLRPGVSLAEAEGALERIATDFRARQVPDWTEATRFRLIPSSDVIIYPPIDRLLVPAAWMLMVTVGLVLVIACANLAGFLLARAVDRRKEVAVRLALGASRAQLVSQLLVETVLVSALGGAVGVWLGRSLLATVLALDLPLPFPITLELALDWRVIGFAALISVLAGVLFSLAPALQSTRLDLASIIRDESAGGGRSKGALRSVLLGGQVAVSVVLLVAAMLFARSFDVTRRADPGFGRVGAALLWAAVRDQGNPEVSIERVQRRLGELAGVTRVGLISNIHLNLVNSTRADFSVDGVDPLPGERYLNAESAGVDSSFFTAAGVRLVAGRTFTVFDTDSSAPVAIVNEAFASQYFAGRDPLGQRFRVPSGQSIEVVGVAGNAKIRSLAEAPQPFIYRPFSQAPTAEPWFVIRTTGDAEQTLGSALALIRETEPEVFVLQSRTMARHLETMSLPLKMAAMALGGFAVLALAIASIGLYGMVSYSVAQRSREVGIRLSLGADRVAVIRLLLLSGLKLATIGAAIGLALALALSRLLGSLLVGVPAADPVTFAVVPVVIVAVTAVAAYLPARRAGRIEPVTALKAD